MSEIEDAFAQVAAEAKRKELPMAAQLRTRSDRRARRRAAVGTLALVAVASAAAVGLLPLAAQKDPNQIAGPTGSVATGPVSPSASPSASPSPAAPPTAGCPGGAYTVQIPAKALVAGTAPGMEDQPLGYRCGRQPSGDAAYALPRICKGGGAPDSDRSILGRRGIYAYLKPPKPDYVPSAYFHTVTRYTAPQAASAYLTELRADTAACGGYRDANKRYAFSLVDGTGAGDESLELTLTLTYDEPVEGAPQEARFTISVIRVGAYVSVVFDNGWEGSPTPPKDLDPVLTAAVTKLLAL